MLDNFLTDEIWNDSDMILLMNAENTMDRPFEKQVRKEGLENLTIHRTLK